MTVDCQKSDIQTLKMVGPIGHKISKLCLIPQRYILAIMAFLAICIGYTMRVSLSMAITEMVVTLNTSEKIRNSSGDCEVVVGKFIPSVKDKSLLYHWDEEVQGIILGSFYWGYVVTHVPAGLLAERFGGKLILGTGLLINGALTLLTPVIVTSSHGNWIILVFVRILQGLGQGVIYPSINALLSNWTPLLERATIGSLTYAGSQIGTIVSNCVSGGLIEASESWASVFYLFGCLGILWCILWALLCYSSPATHPFISDKEKDFLMAELGELVEKQKHKRVPWKAMLTSVPVWALIVAQIGHDWGFYTMVIDLPKYMKDVLKFSVADNGLYSSLPHLLMWIFSLLTGVFCDWLLRNKYVTITFARKLFTSIAAIGPGISIMAASYSGCNTLLAVVFFTISMAAMGPYYSGEKINALDLSPHFAGTLMGLVNGIGALTGIATPYLIGVLTPNVRTLDEWRLVFWVTYGVFVGTTIIYLLFGSGEQEWWSDIQEGGEAEAEKK